MYPYAYICKPDLTTKHRLAYHFIHLDSILIRKLGWGRKTR